MITPYRQNPLFSASDSVHNSLVHISLFLDRGCIWGSYNTQEPPDWWRLFALALASLSWRGWCKTTAGECCYSSFPETCLVHGNTFITTAFKFFKFYKHLIIYSWFQTFTMFWMLYAFFWVIPRRVNFICWHFGTLSVPSS